ncbi:MAG: hypothetical protein KF773_29455 [Deltaproteobacteria bacterium]|nr:hypothetical protein [Deltaproteobacteria bacterium]
MSSRLRFLARWSRGEWIAAGIIVAACVGIAWFFAAQTLAVTRPMGLPLDDSYIYLTYAKQFGRGEPFTYYPGGGYSAGSTSVLWPMLLAPFWTLGARGHALVWVSYAMCTAFYALTCLGVWRIVRRISGDTAGVLAALALVAIAPFAWTSLSGMEVAFASALLVGMILLLLDQSPAGPPSKRLGAILAAASLSRPEATLLVIGIVAIAVVARLRRADRRAAAWWCAPLAAPVLWLIANRVLAGNFFPNTGVAKSHFYQPGFDWSGWLDAVWMQTGKMFKGLFWDGASPLVWPRAFAVAWLAGAVRLALWARRERRYLAGAVIVLAPFVLIGAVIASSGLWDFQNYRYIAPAFPLLAIGLGAALAVPELRDGGSQYAWRAATVVAVLVFAYRGGPNLATNAKVFAQGAMDTNTQVVALGRYIHDKLPNASVMFHDAGAIAYYGDGRVYDMLGLVTNFQAGVANHGPGSRFEFLEGLPPEQRPTHFAYYPSWLGTFDFYGEALVRTPLRPQIAKPRLAGDGDMQILVATFEHAGTGERPLTEHPGWHVVDRVDIAYLASERAHGWRGAIGSRKFGDPTARWSFVARHVGPYGLVLDGGRTIRGGTERFTLDVDPARPTRLVLRTGGNPTVPWDETQPAAVTLAVSDGDGNVLGTLPIPRPVGPFVELAVDVPAGVSEIRTEAPGPYRAFHWFALQPD